MPSAEFSRKKTKNKLTTYLMYEKTKTIHIEAENGENQDMKGFEITCSEVNNNSIVVYINPHSECLKFQIVFQFSTFQIVS